MSSIFSKYSHYSKAIVPVIAILAQIIALGVLTGTPLIIATAVVGLATALGVYKAPYNPAPSNIPAGSTSDEAPVKGA